MRIESRQAAVASPMDMTVTEMAKEVTRPTSWRGHVQGGGPSVYASGQGPSVSQGPEHPEDSELEQIGTMRYDKDDWLWAYPDPTRPLDEDLLSVEELLERRA